MNPISVLVNTFLFSGQTRRHVQREVQALAKPDPIAQAAREQTQLSLRLAQIEASKRFADKFGVPGYA